MSGINTWNLLCCSQRITWELEELDNNPNNPEYIETRAELEGYPKWFYAQAQKINNYQLDKDIKIKGNKIYSKETCLFVSHKENMGRYNKKQPLTGLTYIGTRLNDGHTEEFNNQAEFADKYALHKSTVCQCCLGRSKTTGGWKIIVKEEK